MGDFDVDTQVESRGNGFYGARLSENWKIWGPNGGYLAAIALRAAGAEAAIARPVAVYCHYLRVARFDGVELEVTTLARGRRSESLRVTMRQDDKTVLEAMVRTASAGAGLEHAATTAPAVPAPEDCPRPEDLVGETRPSHAFWRNFDVGVVQPERFANARRDPGPPLVRDWYRVHCAAGFEDPFLDAGRTALLLDTIGWPAAAQAHPDPAYFAPSLDVAVWFHGRGPASDWVLAEAHSPLAKDGTITANGRLFDRRGQLLGSSGTQLMCTPLPGR